MGYPDDINYQHECSAYVQAVGNHIPLKDLYTENSIVNGRRIADDTISILTKVDPDYDGKSYYHDFCDADRNPNPTVQFIVKKEMAIETAKAIRLYGIDFGS